MYKMVTDIFSLRSSDDNKKNAFKNGDNSGYGLNSLHVNRPLQRAIANVQIYHKMYQLQTIVLLNRVQCEMYVLSRSCLCFETQLGKTLFTLSENEVDKHPGLGNKKNEW